MHTCTHTYTCKRMCWYKHTYYISHSSHIHLPFSTNSLSLSLLDDQAEAKWERLARMALENPIAAVVGVMEGVPQRASAVRRSQVPCAPLRIALTARELSSSLFLSLYRCVARSL